MNKNYWEDHLYFGKLKKTPEMNMSCFIIGIDLSFLTDLAADMFIKVRKASSTPKSSEP